MGIKELIGASAPRGGFRQKFRAALYGCAAGALLLGTTQAVAGAVVTDTVFSQSTQGQNNVPVTFGQVFKAGDVPRGATLAATLNGQPVTLQVNPKATNPDGSLRHAVLTAMVPSLPAGAKLPLTLYTGAALSGPTIGLSQLLATGYDAKISLNIGGTVYTASARSLLQAANLAGACAAWDPQCNVWLSGPLASEWVVNGPAVSSSGANAPGLRVYFAVRAYSNGTPGTVGRVRTDIIVENSNAFAPQSQPQYTATLTSGSASYTSPALTQYTATRWHKVLWWNNDEPQVYLQQDTQYIQNSMAVSRYMPLTPSESFLASLRQSCAPLDNCDQTSHMANTGAQPAIGPLARWDSLYVIDPDARAYNWMLANADALGTYSVHYRDEVTGYPLSIQKHPYVSITNWGYAYNVSRQSTSLGQAYKADLLPNCVNNAVVTSCAGWYGTGNPYLWDNAHQPSWAYVPYMVTGSYFYMSELAFNASYNEIWSNALYRGYGQGLIDEAHSQVRGKAWTLRNLAEAAWLLPDSYPLKAEFNADVNNSLADWNRKYTNNPNANPLHVMDFGAGYSVNGGKDNGTTSWQHNFLTWAAGHVAELGFPGAAQFRNWLAPFEISLMTDWQSNPTQGYCWLQASAYAIAVKDASGNWLPSFNAVYKETFPTLVGLACNTPQMVAAMAKLPGNPNPGQVGEMYGYAYSATGFPANFQVGIAAAADTGLPSAQTAWSIFESRSVKPNGANAYNNYPNFAVIPRNVQAGPIPPPTMPSTLDPPPTPNPPPVTPPPVTPTPPPVQVTPPTAPTTPPITVKPPPTTPAPQPVATPPPVPKELPARQCAGGTCTSAALPGVSSAEPVRTGGSTPPAPAIVSNTTSSSKVSANTATTAPKAESAAQAPTSTVRFLVRVVCTRLNTWCVRYLPQGLYLPAPQSARPQPIAGAAVPARAAAPASPVAQSVSPGTRTKYSTVQDDSGRIVRR